MVRAEDSYNYNNVPYILMDCIRALEQSDAREVFIF
jgi:hypothetical protein